MSLELLHESFKNEIDELEEIKQKTEEYIYKNKRNEFYYKLSNIISNMEGLCDALYIEYENNNMHNYKELKQKYNILLQILNEKSSYEDKLYLRIKHNIDLDEKCG